MTKNLGDFRKADIHPKGPSPAQGYLVSAKTPTSDDEARYILKPDREFLRPWIATPGGSAYVFPGGIQGFQLQSNAETGIHHYLGDVGTDISVIYPDELHIILTGTFLGHTSISNLHAMRSVILQQTIYGHILGLPGIQSQLLYAVPINHQFSHDPGDPSHDVSYSVEFVKTGTGSIAKTPPLQLPQSNPVLSTRPKGKSKNQITTKPGLQTFRAIAQKVYSDISMESIFKLIDKNSEALDAANIPSSKRANTKLPVGFKVNW